MSSNKTLALFLFVSHITAVIIFYPAFRLNASASPSEASWDNTHMVSLLKDKADPDIVLAQVGDYVQFNARDGRQHILEQGSGNAVDKNHAHKEGVTSGVFNSDEAYKVQFKKVGIYSFHDHKNADIYIRVIVNDKK